MKFCFNISFIVLLGVSGILDRDRDIKWWNYKQKRKKKKGSLPRKRTSFSNLTNGHSGGGSYTPRKLILANSVWLALARFFFFFWQAQIIQIVYWQRVIIDDRIKTGVIKANKQKPNKNKPAKNMQLLICVSVLSWRSCSFLNSTELVIYLLKLQFNIIKCGFIYSVYFFMFTSSKTVSRTALNDRKCDNVNNTSDHIANKSTIQNLYDPQQSLRLSHPS